MTTRVFALRAAAVSALLLSSTISAFAQSSSPLAFDAASVRVASPGMRASQRITDTRVDIVNTPMRWVLLTAFGIAPFQLVAPDWVDQVRIDIQATIPTGRIRRDVPEMLRTLLRERLGLITHVEPRPLDVFELRVDQDGVKMTEVQPVDELSQTLLDDDSAKAPAAPVHETVEGPVRNSMITIGQRTTTARTRYDRIYTAQRTVVVDAARMSMAELVSVLSFNLDEPVLDKTGLTGLYKFTVELPPDVSAVRSMLALGITTTVKGTSLTEPTGVSVFKAMEGIGLQLERRRSPVDVVVVDKLNRTPTPN